jgi:hypothetical protein
MGCRAHKHIGEFVGWFNCMNNRTMQQKEVDIVITNIENNFLVQVFPNSEIQQPNRFSKKIPSSVIPSEVGTGARGVVPFTSQPISVCCKLPAARLEIQSREHQNSNDDSHKDCKCYLANLATLTTL